MARCVSERRLKEIELEWQEQDNRRDAERVTTHRQKKLVEKERIRLEVKRMCL
jgi:hypothetical protein